MIIALAGGLLILGYAALNAFPQLQHLQPNVFFQQDGAPPHWSLDMQHFQATGENEMLQRTGLHVPVIMLMDFFLWDYMKDRIYAT
jgi:hypothetical protein